MDINLTTPALLFPAISLLLLAYSNRFLAIAARIRELHALYRKNQDRILLRQIASLRQRVCLIRDMQLAGVGSLFLCVLCMFLLFYGETRLGQYVFAASLVLMMASLGYSLRELFISVRALNMQLSDLEENRD